MSAELEEARRDLDSLRDTERKLRAELEIARRQSAQVVELLQQEAVVESKMARLELVLDLAPVTRHVREAIARSASSADRDTPFTVENLLPSDVHDAAVDAIPAPVLLADSRPGDRHLALPPRIAPTYVIATWMFLNDVAKDLIGPLLAGRFATRSAAAPVAAPQLSRSWLVPRLAGAPRLVDGHPSDLFQLVVPLGRVHPNSSWVLPGGQAEVALPGSHAQDGSYDWHVGFRLRDKPARSRRRHGDIDSWGPAQG